MKKYLTLLQSNPLYYYGIAVFIFLISLNSYLLFILLISYLYYFRRRYHFITMIVLISFILILIFKYNETKNQKMINNITFLIVDIKEYDKKSVITLYNKNKRYNLKTNKNYKLGSYLLVSGEIKEYDHLRIPNGFDAYKYYQGKGILGEIVNYQISDLPNYNYLYYIQEKIRNIDSNEYLKIFFQGEKSEVNDDLKILNITHYLSLSGIHLYLLIEILKFFMRQFDLKKQDYYITSMLLIVCIITNYKMTILRFVVYYIFRMINRFKNLKLDDLSLLNLSFLFLICLFPFNMFSQGFLLMYLLGNAILLLRPIYADKSFVLKNVIISSIISIILIPFNNSINVLSILLSPIFLLGIIYILLPYSIIIAVVPSFSVLNIDVIFEKVIQYIADRRINFNFSIPTMSAYAKILFYTILILIFFVSNKKRIILVFLQAFIMIIPIIKIKTSSPTLYFLDVGQGDSAVYISGEVVIVVDAYKNVSGFLKSLGIKRINYLIITHSDNDHSEEANTLIDNFLIDNIIINKHDEKYRIYNKNILEVDAGYIINYKEVIMEFYGPIRRYDSTNNNSLVFKLKYFDSEVLFTGDIEKEAEIDIANYYGDRLKSNILKIAHHGSNTSTSKEILLYIKPEIAIISLGKNNKYGFPNSEVIQNLYKEKVMIYRTDQDTTLIYKDNIFYKCYEKG